jgi:glycosyltransferase involved in cell wall biosynthesis
LKRWTLRRCRAVTVVSRSLANKVEALAAEIPVDVIPMGTDLKFLFTPPTNPATRQVKEIVFVGRLVETKGLRYLLEAFAVVLRTEPDLVLTIVGDGPMRGKVLQLIAALGQERSVRLLGGVPQTDLPDIYRRAALAVFPYSDQEGFGLVVVEAMGCGCPVIASDLPAIREIIEPGVTGILTPPRDSAALADAIRQCLADAALRSRLATTALDSVRNQFDWPSIAARYSQTIENCMQ